MSCDKFHEDVVAFLNGELGIRASDELRLHAEECSTCAAEIRANVLLTDMLKSHPDRDVPKSVEDRVLNGLEPLRIRRRRRAARPQRSSIQGMFSMKRSLIAAGMVVAIAFLVAVLSPKADPAVAAVAQAMSSVRNVHITGWILQDGKRCRLEGWIEGSSRVRTNIEGSPDEVIDGERLIEISEDSVVIRSSKSSSGPEIPSPMLGFSGDFWKEMAHRSKNSGSVTKSDGLLLDGRPALVFTLEWGGDQTAITIAKDTNLVARIQVYDSSNEVTLDMQHIEYNVEIPAEVFDPEYPASAQVLDLLNQQTGNDFTKRFMKLQQTQHIANLRGGAYAVSRGEKFPTIYHPGYVFETLSSAPTAVFFNGENYIVLGSVKEYDAEHGSGFSQTIKDGSIRLPSKPHVEQTIMLDGKPGDYCRAAVDDDARAVQLGASADHYRRAYRFLNVGPNRLTITWNRLRDEYTIKGRARLLPVGDVYENCTIGWTADVILKVPRGLWTSKHLDFQGLPQSDVEAMKAEIDFQQHLDQVGLCDPLTFCWLDTVITPDERIVSGSDADRQFTGDLKFEALGPGTQLLVSADQQEREFWVVGRARLHPSGQIVKNGIISYDGSILSNNTTFRPAGFEGKTRSLESELERVDKENSGVLGKLKLDSSKVAELIIAGVRKMDEMEKRQDEGASRSWQLARPIALNIAKTHTLPPGSKLTVMWLSDADAGTRTSRLDLYISLTDQGEIGYGIPLTETHAANR